MTKNKTIKFFISSTFKDFEGERNILQKFVFPELKKLCHESGFGFQPIDLRWGIKEEAGYDQQTMNICLNEIKRSSHKPSPNLLLLVGQRYGWVPIPYEIEKYIFDEIISYYKKIQKIDYYKVHFAKTRLNLLKEWYILDENSNPRKYFLKDKYKYKDNRTIWSNIENILRDTLQKFINNSFEKKIYNKFHTSATEQEMYLGLDAFDKTKKHDHTYAYFREIENYDIKQKEVQDYIDKDLTKLDELKNKLQNECNIPIDNQIFSNKLEWSEIEKSSNIKYENLTLENAPDYLKNFYDDILKKFSASIQKEIDEFKEQTKLQTELEQQKLFLEKKSEVVLGRESEVKNIKSFINEDFSQYYLQYGKSGTGKTAVMAKAISEIDTSKYKVIYRFIGTTASSTYSRQVFENIYCEIESKIKKNEKLLEKEISFEYEDDKFQKQFRDKLKQYQELIDKPLIIFLDAVDQFEDKNDLSILLEDLPSNIKVVFSCLYDKTKKENEDYFWYFDRLEYIKNKNKLSVLSDNKKDYKDIMIDILDTWLSNINRQISLDQKTHIKNNILTKNSTPLYLRLIFEIVKHWKHDETKLDLAQDEKGLIYQFFDFIVSKYHHEEILLNETLGLISASKDGLSEEELLDLFKKNKKLLDKYQDSKGRYPKLDKLPNAIWSRFYYYIQDIFTEKLIDGEMLISPYHRIIEEVINKEYYEKNKQELHEKLANYFYTLQDKSKTWNKRYNNLHMLSEYPYQLFHANKSNELREILFDLEFAGSVYDNHKQESFRNIMEKASTLEGITEDEIYPWESFYREKEFLITKVDEELYRPHQSLFQLAYEDGLNSPLHEKSKKLLEEDKIQFNWLKRTNISSNFIRTGLLYIGKINSKLDIFKQYEDKIVSNNFNKFRKEKRRIIQSLNKKFDINVSRFKKPTILINKSTNETIEIETFKRPDIHIIEALTCSIFLICAKKYHIQLWSIDGVLIKEVEAHTDTIVDIIKLSKDKFLSFSYDNKIKLWDFKGNLIRTFYGHIDRIKEVMLLKNNHILSFSSDKTIKIWNEEGNCLASLSIYDYVIINIIELENNILIAIGKDNILLAWDLTKVISNKMNSNSPIEYIRNYDNNILAYLYDDSMVLFDKKGSITSTFEGHNDYIVGSLKISSNSILTYSHDSLLKLWSFNGNLLSIFNGHTDHILGVLKINDEKIVSYSKDNTIRLWNLLGYCLKIIYNSNDEIHGVEKLSDNQNISWFTNGGFIVFDNNGIIKHQSKLRMGTFKDVIPLKNGKFSTFSFLNNKLNIDSNRISFFIRGKQFNTKITRDNDPVIRLWNKHFTLENTLIGHKERITKLVEYKNNIFISCSDDFSIKLWDSNGHYICGLNEHSNKIINILRLTDDLLLTYSLNEIIIWEFIDNSIKILKIIIIKNMGFFSVKVLKNILMIFSKKHKLIIKSMDDTFKDQVYFSFHDDFRLLDDKIIVFQENTDLKFYEIKETKKC